MCLNFVFSFLFVIPAVCTLGYVNCFVNPCRFATCPNHPTATCRANYCGGCNAEWFIGPLQVNCQGEHFYPFLLTVPRAIIKEAQPPNVYYLLLSYQGSVDCKEYAWWQRCVCVCMCVLGVGTWAFHLPVKQILSEISSLSPFLYRYVCSSVCHRPLLSATMSCWVDVGQSQPDWLLWHLSPYV